MTLKEKIFEVCGTNDLLALVLSGGDVRRYHQEGGHVYMQPVSEHTYRVMAILLHFWPDASRELLIAAFYHDSPAERVTGDPPATVKAVFPSVRAVYDDIEREVMDALGLPNENDLEPIDYARLKVADYVELCITCKSQPGRRPQRIYERGRQFVEQYAIRLPDDERAMVDDFMRKLRTNLWEA